MSLISCKNKDRIADRLVGRGKWKMELFPTCLCPAVLRSLAPAPSVAEPLSHLHHLATVAAGNHYSAAASLQPTDL